MPTCSMDGVERKFDDERTDGFQQVGSAFRIKGTSFRLKAAQSFAKAAIKAYDKGRKVTVELQREPTNNHSDSAVMVIGVVEIGFTRFKRQKRWHIGYLPHELSWGIACEIPPAHPLDARLWRVFLSDEGVVSVTIILLVGPIDNPGSLPG